ncbi:hypothetical protein [Neorhodopirellula lusitana]|uniref:hypothetical protein n=1 Tax=Neorhodopirellula lusitana TaxID=445327 RepID=UPI0024B76671|nr:hypothetical protein [Neorhodopirellula lusitana]
MSSNRWLARESLFKLASHDVGGGETNVLIFQQFGDGAISQAVVLHGRPSWLKLRSAIEVAGYFSVSHLSSFPIHLWE